MTAISNATLAELGGKATVPGYDRAALSGGIVHFGVGNFHRAHQCVYLDDLFALGRDHDWAVTGATIRLEDREHQRDLAEQDCLYTVTEVDDGVAQTRVIGSILRYLEPGDRDAILAALTAPQTRLVTLTVTEGGYYMSGDAPDLDHPDLAADAADLSAARTVFGLLAAAVRTRRDAGLAPFTILSCDNLPHNGVLTRRLVEGVAGRADSELGAFVAREIAFPNSMVDRITPATTPQQRDTLRTEHGIEDRRPVFCEPFRQWVIEDVFPAGRPGFEAVGVTFVDDVTPYELMKLRILNAGHATIAYPAALVGLRFAHEAMRDPQILAFFEAVERGCLLPASPQIEGVSREDYLATVTHRFANPAIGDQIRRLALDGSNRQPKFVLPAVRELRARGADVSGLALVQALWCRYCEGTMEDGSVEAPNDPNWDALQAAAKAARTQPRRFLEQRDIFGDLADDAVYAELFAAHLDALWSGGVRATLAGFLGR